MKRNCQICKAEYNPYDYPTFFYMKYCSEACERKAKVEALAFKTGVHMYMCVSPLPITLVDIQNQQQIEIILEGSKWQRDETKSQGLNAVHLIDLSGQGKVGWIEIDEAVLAKHFERC